LLNQLDRQPATELGAAAGARRIPAGPGFTGGSIRSRRVE
jgi:hypothetical protein